ncbi:MAG TPA: hypothetical protein VJL27_00275 [Patescibacteria group bacterium]|nr:hypothetical protein [Patescibacteria group bacterium]
MTEEKRKSRAWYHWLPIFSKEHLEKPLLRWEAPEFFFVAKNPVWGVVAALVFVALAGLFIFFGQFLVAVLTLVFLIVAMKLAYAKPENLEYRIDDEGLRIAGWLHPYEREIIGFWTAKQGRNNVVYFKTRSIWSEHFAVPLGDVAPKKIAKILANHIPELVSLSTPRIASSKR